MSHSARKSDASPVSYILILAIVIYVLPFGGQTLDKKKEEVLQVKVWTDRGRYGKYEDIPIHVQLTNVSTHNLLIGRDIIWGNFSPSRVIFVVEPSVGHTLTYQNYIADRFLPKPKEDFAGELLDWCFSLPPGHSYSATASLQHFVAQSDLVPGVYKIRGRYIASGIDQDVYYNPLIRHPDTLAKLLPQNWSGEVESQDITIRIAAGRSKGTTRRATK